MKFNNAPKMRQNYRRRNLNYDKIELLRPPPNNSRRINKTKPATRLFVQSPTRHSVWFMQDVFQDRTDLRCPQPHFLHHLFRIFHPGLHIARRDREVNHSARAAGIAHCLLHRIHDAQFTTPQQNANGYFAAARTGILSVRPVINLFDRRAGALNLPAWIIHLVSLNLSARPKNRSTKSAWPKHARNWPRIPWSC